MTDTTVTGWLLDTHALLWMLHGDTLFSKPAVQATDSPPPHHSSANFLEIAIKLSDEGIDFEVTDDWNQIFPDEFNRIGVPLLSPTINGRRLLQAIPRNHGAPLDRVLVCHAKRFPAGVPSLRIRNTSPQPAKCSGRSRVCAAPPHIPPAASTCAQTHPNHRKTQKRTSSLASSTGHPLNDSHAGTEDAALSGDTCRRNKAE